MYESFTWQATDGLFLVRGLLRQPEIIEPFDDLVLDAVWNPPQAHIRLHAVKFGCNEVSFVVTVCDIMYMYSAV